MRTRTGLLRWDRSTIWRVLSNPAYAGNASFGKTESVQPVSNPVARKSGIVPRRQKSSCRRKPQEQWISVSVPEIVKPSTFEAAAEQLQRNKQFAARNKKGHFLLSGLLVCQRCAQSLYAKLLSATHRKDQKRDYAYYRCRGTDNHLFVDGRICDSKQIRTDELDEAIWESVVELLNEPERVLKEFGRRQSSDGMDLGLLKNQKESLLRGKKKAEVSLQRLLDAYQAGAVELEELKPRMAKLRDTMRVLEEQIHESERTIATTL